MNLRDFPQPDRRSVAWNVLTRRSNPDEDAQRRFNAANRDVGRLGIRPNGADLRDFPRTRTSDSIPTALPSWSRAQLLVVAMSGLLMWVGIIWMGWHMYSALMEAVQRAGEVTQPW